MEIPEKMLVAGVGGGQRLTIDPIEPANFLRRGFRQGGCHLVAQTQGYHLVCIWGSLVKFQRGGDKLKSILCAGRRIC